jgi:hypothetical protein
MQKVHHEQQIKRRWVQTADAETEDEQQQKEGGYK